MIASTITIGGGSRSSSSSSSSRKTRKSEDVPCEYFNSLTHLHNPFEIVSDSELGLNTNDIMRITDNLFPKSRSSLFYPHSSLLQFLGVFPSDQIPYSKLFNTKITHSVCCIVNTDPSSLPGKHWVAFFNDASFKNNKSSLEFFDSFGLKPSFYKLGGNTSIEFQSNPFPLQSSHSTVCGHYCILYLYLRSRYLANHIQASASQTPLECICKYFRGLGKSALIRDQNIKLIVLSLNSKIDQINKKFTCHLPHASSLTSLLSISPSISLDPFIPSLDTSSSNPSFTPSPSFTSIFDIASINQSSCSLTNSGFNF